MRFFLCLRAIGILCLVTPSALGNSPEILEVENEVHAQKIGGPWVPAQAPMPLQIGDVVRTGEFSRATVRLADHTIDRMDELTTIQILQVKDSSNQSAIDIKKGAVYFFSRERDQKIEISTPAVNGALRGTQIVVRVNGSKTEVAVLEGSVFLSNSRGELLVEAGELASATIGTAPRKTALIEAANIIQWILYYPAVINTDELALSNAEKYALRQSLAAYRAGNPLRALALFPKNFRPTSPAARSYRAAALTSVGSIDQAKREIQPLAADAPARRAFQDMIAAVQFQKSNEEQIPNTSSEWLARSYYLQSRSNLPAARDAATQATQLAPDFGYAWVRLAELEFSFGRISQAKAALERGLAIAPENAQGYALKGFLLSAENRVMEARSAFDQAIRLDGALANGWLGRGLTYLRKNRSRDGIKDLQTAATVEPNRSLLFSYLGKAFADGGEFKLAGKDLRRAQELDSEDPTPWLYSALWNKQQNRYNLAIADLERSVELNNNRQVYRSRFLLDQDLSVRGANLAAIYQDNGMESVSVQEAVRAVNVDYGNAAAHLFLANALDRLRDPNRILLRYETAWFNELLLANMLSPVGAGPLSQFVSQQEYSKMFESEGFGFSSDTGYLGTGEIRETASQFGTFGNVSYSLDTEYYYDPGTRFNNSIRRSETYASAKVQLAPDDTLFFQLKFQDYKGEDLRRLYDDVAVGKAARTLETRDQQVPGLVLAGYRHTWAPGTHTLAIFSRLASEVSTSVDRSDAFDLFTFSNPYGPPTLNDFPVGIDNTIDFEVYSGEVNQILTLGDHLFVGGMRFQQGSIDTGNSYRPARAGSQNAEYDIARNTYYIYDTWQPAPWVSITGGVAIDQLTYPVNFRNPPITGGETSVTKVLPKIGAIVTPDSTFTLRAAYAESLSGVSFDESVRLEPTQVAGFNQSFRTVIPEDVAGAVEGALIRTFGASVEKRFPTRTYVSAGYQRLAQDLSRAQGIFNTRLVRNNTSRGLFYTNVPEQISFQENVFTANIHQLLGEEWSVGTNYRYAKADLETGYGGRHAALFPSDPQTSALHELDLFALFNHPSGFFARADALWFKQDDEFWQLNLMAGWRFYRNQGELAVGLVNLTDTDYRLNPLNYYSELPRERTFLVRFKLNF